MKNPSLSANLSKRDPDDIEFDAAVKEFHGGSDRVAAIMGAALIENAMVAALQSALENTDDEAALFHDAGAPFGTFRARIVAANAMGLLLGPMPRDLDIIRDIRNQFAHALLSLDFENEHIAAAVNKLDDYTYHGEPGRAVSENRRKFESACWTISLLLLRKANQLSAEKLEKLKRGQLMGATLSQLVSAGLQGRQNDGVSDITTDQFGVKN